VLTKYWRRQIQAHTNDLQVQRSISLLFWPGKVHSSWLLSDLAGVPGYSLPASLYGGTSSHTVLAWLNWPAMPKSHCQDFTDFRSQYLYKWLKAKKSLSLSNISFSTLDLYLESVVKILRNLENCSN
jgi:hypothetical protein